MTKNIKIESFVNADSQEGTNNPSRVLYWRRLAKNNQTISLMNFYNKNEKKSYIRLTFQNKIQSVHNCFKMLENLITSQ